MAGTFCGKLDITDIPQNEMISYQNSVWVKADVEEKIFLINDNGLTRPGVVIKFSEGCFANLCTDELEFGAQLAQKAGTDQTQTGASQNTPTSVTQGSTQKARAISGPISRTTDELRAVQNAIDSRTLNNFGFMPGVVLPTAAAIPMKSNILSFGPYVSPNFNSGDGVFGGLDVETNTDLAPWVFGSTFLMNEAGNQMVQYKNATIVKSATGSMTLPGLPVIGNFGFPLNQVGPNLTGVNFSLGANGVSTSYEFKTYTPKFGGLSRYFLDKFKLVAKNRTEQLKFLRSNQITINKIGNKINATASKGSGSVLNKNLSNAYASPGSRSSLQRIITGEIYDWHDLGDGKKSQRTIVGIDKLFDSVGEMIYDYPKKAYMSLDGLFAPVSVNGANQYLPRFASFEMYNVNLGASKSVNPNPPAYKAVNNNEALNSLYINRDYLNPLTNPTTTHHHAGQTAGHCIDIVGRETEIPPSGIINSFYPVENSNRYSSDYRFLALKGPLVLQAWGYDTNGKPIPNEVEDENNLRSGQFNNDINNTGYKDRFLKDWLQKPATWPVGPIDLRYDRTRGVWVSPPEYKPVQIVAEETIDGSSNNATRNGSIITDQLIASYKDKDGLPVTNPSIDITKGLGNIIHKGDKGIGIFNDFTGSYFMMPFASILRWGKFDGAWPKNTSQNITIFKPTKGGGATPVTQGESVEVHNFFADISTQTDAWCLFFEQEGYYYLIAVECE
jgi:hypothetical protein